MPSDVCTHSLPFKIVLYGTGIRIPTYIYIYILVWLHNLAYIPPLRICKRAVVGRDQGVTPSLICICSGPLAGNTPTMLPAGNLFNLNLVSKSNMGYTTNLV